MNIRTLDKEEKWGIRLDWPFLPNPIRLVHRCYSDGHYNGWWLVNVDTSKKCVGCSEKAIDKYVTITNLMNLELK